MILKFNLNIDKFINYSFSIYMCLQLLFSKHMYLPFVGSLKLPVLYP